MQKKGKRVFFIGFICAVLLGSMAFLYVGSTFQLKQNLKKQCGIGMDCVCFEHVVDNRLTDKQLRVFTKFLESVKTRPTTSILEFTDENSAHEISSLIALCRLDMQEQKTSK